MKDLFWSIFEKSGNIDSFMAYKDYENFEINSKNTINNKANEYSLRDFNNFNTNKI